MSRDINDKEKHVLREAMDMVIKSKKPMQDVAEDVRKFLREAADDAAKTDPGRVPAPDAKGER